MATPKKVSKVGPVTDPVFQVVKANKRVRFAKFATKEGKLNASVATKVVRLRDVGRLSWVKIGEEIGCTPRMALRIYDAKKGPGAHHGLLPGKGGRLPEGKTA